MLISAKNAVRALALALAFSSAAAAPALAPAAFAQPAAASTVPSGVYEIDPTHRYLGLTYSHMGFSRTVLRIEDFSATLTLDAANPQNSSVSATMQIASLRSAVSVFDGHLAGPQFFNTAAFPTAQFRSTALTLTSPTTATMVGDLTLKGATHPVTLNVTLYRGANHPMNGKPTIGFRATGSLLRSQWGLGAYAPNVGDEVEIVIDAEFQQQSAPAAR